MRTRAWIPVVVAVATSCAAAAGCQNVSGLSDLEKDPTFQPDAARADGSGADTTVTLDDTGDDSTAADDTSVPAVDTGTATAMDTKPAATDTKPATDTRPATDTKPATDTAGPPTCASLGGQVSNGHCYWIVTTAAAWSDTACGAGAHLVTLTSTAEYDFVKALSGADFWIGLRAPDGMQGMKDQYKWVTGEVGMPTPEPWAMPFDAAAEPDGTGPCVRLRADETFADRACADTFPIGCERDTP